MRRQRRRKQKINIKSLYFVLPIILIVLLGIGLSYYYYIKKQVNKWNNLILPNVYINNIDLSGKTKEEAASILNQYSDKLDNKVISLNINDKIKTYSYKDIDASFNVEKSVNKALEYGKNKNVIKKHKLISHSNKKDINIPLSYNKEKLNAIVKEIQEEYKLKPKNAEITINQGKINISKEEQGYNINEKSLKKAIIKSLNSNLEDVKNITVDLISSKPSITYKDLSKIKSVPMSTYSTSFASSSAERAKNLEVVTSLINGIVLMPGETFSYSDISQKGRGQYLDAAVYINNKVEQAEAGGICQVSSTLYNAIMRANIPSVERTNHSLPVSYVPLGLDATVSWGYLDYKFKNTYDFPIYIEGIIYNRNLTFNIYGDKSALNGVTYDMTSNVIDTISPEVEYIDDNSLEKGTEVTESYGQAGYKVESYLLGYKEGKEISRKHIATDIYAATKTVIKRGIAENKENETNNEKKEENENKNEVKTEEMNKEQEESENKPQ